MHNTEVGHAKPINGTCKLANSFNHSDHVLIDAMCIFVQTKRPPLLIQVNEFTIFFFLGNVIEKGTKFSFSFRAMLRHIIDPFITRFIRSVL